MTSSEWRRCRRLERLRRRARRETRAAPSPARAAPAGIPLELFDAPGTRRSVTFALRLLRFPA